MPDIVHVGPLAVRGVLLALFISAAAGAGVMKVILHKLDAEDEALWNRLFSAFVIGMAGWKLSAGVFAPELFFRRPLYLLQANPGLPGLWIGMAAFALAMLWSFRRNITDIGMAADSLAAGFAAGLFLYDVLIRAYGYPTSLPWGITGAGLERHYHPVHLYTAVLDLILGIFLLTRKREIWGTGRVCLYVLIGSGLMFWAAGLFAPARSAAAGLSAGQWRDAAMVFLGLGGFSLLQRRRFQRRERGDATKET